MKRRKKDFDIFNLSFLDIISCAFGAVVLLVLISNTADDGSQSNVDEVESLLGQVITLETRIEGLAQEIDQQKEKNDEQLAESGGLGRAAQTLSENLGRKEREEKELEGDLEDFLLFSLP